jgi:type IV secretory pathway TraG/TraD family ATPase VirD4
VRIILDGLGNASAQLAGFGVKMVFIVQALDQLKELYKDNWETFIANANVCNVPSIKCLINSHKESRRVAVAHI